MQDGIGIVCVPLVMKPTGDFDGVGEFFKLFFILALSICNGMLDSGVLVRGEFNLTDCQTKLALASQIQIENSIDNCSQFSRFSLVRCC